MYQIDFSPIRSPNHKNKPIISFKLSSPVLKERSLSQNQKVDDFLLKNQSKLPIYNVKKQKDKENILIPKPIETYSSRMILESKSSRREITSIEKEKNSKKQPIFIDKNSKQTLKEGQKNCETCQKQQQSYIILNDNLKCCSNCALEQMKNGKQVRSIRSKNIIEDPVKQQLPIFGSLTVNIRPPVQENDSVLIDRIQRNCDELLQMIEKRLDDGRSVKESFIDKRCQLKKHYERMKAAIQQAIRKDLQNLRVEEQRQLKEMGIRIDQTKTNICQLNSIKVRISELRESNNKRFQNIPENKRSQLNCQLRGYVDTIQTIIQKQSMQGQSVDFNIDEQLYRPEKYMATVSKSCKILEWEDFSSFNTSEEFQVN